VGRLIVNADDFGLTRGVNRAIVELHHAGLLTSATLMARAAATEDAIAVAQATPSLGVGCHIVLVDGDPVLPASQIRSLMDRKTGQFLPTPGAFLQRLVLGNIDFTEVQAECVAQIALLQSSGVQLTHIDTHKHMHMFPAVLRPILNAAHTAGIHAVRNPYEPAWSARATPGAPLTRRMQVGALRLLASVFRRVVVEHGFTTTDGAVGVLATGTLDAATLTSLLQQMPEGRFELVTHPGYNDADLARVRTRLRDSRETERAALKALRQFTQIELISFAAASSSRPGAS
jgi:hopanoid biosynthesis associated protein HpnK